MKQTGNPQINTKEHWDAVYIAERGSGKLRIDTDRLAFVLENITGKTFLDVGCGNGEMLHRLYKENPKPAYSGCDIANGIIHLASMEYPHLRFAVGNAESLPYEDGSFDTVWCGETLEHLDDPHKAIKELFRVCKSGGHVIVSVPLRGNNPSDEHMWEFTLMDLIAIPDGTLIDIDVKCGGLSQIACYKK